MIIYRLFLPTLLIVGSLVMQNCNKWPTDSREGIFGSWNWKRSVGGFAGEVIDADSVDYVKGLYLGEDFTYKEFINDSTIISSTFTVENREDMNGDTVLAIVVAEPHPDIPYYTIQYVCHDSLILEDSCIDCYVHKYVRIFRNI